MTTQIEFEKYLKENGYVKKIDKYWKISVYFGLGLLFLLVLVYGFESDGFKSNIILNNTVNPAATNIANTYSFNPNTSNDYETKNNYTIVNNITIINKMNCT